MIVTFNKHTGIVTDINENIDTYNKKSVIINDISFDLYKKSILDNKKIADIDTNGNLLYNYNNTYTSIINDDISFELDRTETVELDGKETTFILGDINSEKIVKELDNIYKESTRINEYRFPDSYKTVDINIDNVMEQHYRDLLEQSDSEFIIADNISDLKSILISGSKFRTLNKREITLNPGDIIKLKSVELLKPCNIFKILEINNGVDIKINDILLNGILEFSTPITRANISFINRTNNVIILDSYAIGYSLTISKGGA